MNRKASISVLGLGAFRLLSILFVIGKGEEKGNESNTIHEEDEGKKEEIFLLTPLMKWNGFEKKWKPTIKSTETNK